MIKDRELPDYWLTSGASHSGEANQLHKLPGGPQWGSKGYGNSLRIDVGTKIDDGYRPAGGSLVTTTGGSGLKDTKPPTKPNGRQKLPTERLLAILKRWELWAVLTIAICGGLGGASLAMLLKLPPEPDCENNVWAMISARERLYCAQREANLETVQGLIDAISHANALPQDHPLRAQINQQIEKWSELLLVAAEETFQQGKLDTAIAAVGKIPTNTRVAPGVKDRIKRWQSIWKEAQAVEQEVDKLLEKGSWFDAFAATQKLLSVGNTYWETTRYNQLNEIIQATQEEGKTLDNARRIAEAGGMKNLTEAIKLIENINPKSKIYKPSRNLIDQWSREILKIAQENLERQQWQDAIYIARQVPDSSSVVKEAEDFITLAQAQSQAERKTTRNLDDAISTAKNIGAKSKFYGEAQKLIALWQLEMKDAGYLERARTRAELGTVQDLKAAIIEAQKIAANNPLAEEASSEIENWQNQIDITEDRPYLLQAEDLAVFGDLASLQAAIATASQIKPGRALYQEAQNKIDMWRREIERSQDQPILDRAQQLADAGDLATAISIAQRIGSGRALYNQAQSSIFAWETEIRDRQTLAQANQVGNSATTAASLIQAIETANQVSYVSTVRSQAEAAIDRWSQQLFRLAQEQSNSDIAAAIKLAENIPFYAGNYQEVQRQIGAWKSLIEPPPVVNSPQPPLPVTNPEPEPLAPTANPEPEPLAPTASPEPEPLAPEGQTPPDPIQ
ncbi:hypothetical protein [[Phormidium] sp. ETS-05]|uniref:hypothetical protein n=1 Tax=[Phormidium] sp. ETS-05 TaxID=222819 RepID=UPI0018EEE511|nr:hypothetical protein [[Phormidium] sp. ETS-05]